MTRGASRHEFYAAMEDLAGSALRRLNRRSTPLNADPLDVDFDRAAATAAPFGHGRHACPGAVLARRELQVFLEEYIEDCLPGKVVYHWFDVYDIEEGRMEGAAFA